VAGIRLALAQINPTVGDLEGNRLLIEQAIGDARRQGADLVALPELAVTGYPPEDLVLRPSFVEDNLRALRRLAPAARDVIAVVGFVDREGDDVFNAAAVLSEGEVRAVYHKHLLPNYGVFDEMRYFRPGEGLVLGRVRDTVFGVTVCEDLWRADGPHAACVAAGAELIVNIIGSPYHMG
jgi:NAD+ synthase (glutamine-hydrolysing)